MKTSSLKITPEMLRLIAEVDEFKGSWRAMMALAPERLAVRRVATIESIGSSARIEGAKLTDQEVEALLGRLEQTAFESHDEQEVAGYAEVMPQITTSPPARPTTAWYRPATAVPDAWPTAVGSLPSRSAASPVPSGR